MHKLFLIMISTLLMADLTLVDGLERASSPEKRDACALAKSNSKKNYDVKDMNVGCTCEKSDSREWTCFVKFKYLPKDK